MDVAQWLQDLGLPNYAVLFREQAIDAEVLPSLTDADFEKLGLPLGHRKKLLTAIAALQAAPSSTASVIPFLFFLPPGVLPRICFSISNQFIMARHSLPWARFSLEYLILNQEESPRGETR
jgi:hypothetical protein